MKEFRYLWIVGLVVTAALIAVPVLLFASSGDAVSPDPWAYVQPTPAHTNHAAVSYTHLDVYKRQLVGLPPAARVRWRRG